MVRIDGQSIRVAASVTALITLDDIVAELTNRDAALCSPVWQAVLDPIGIW